MANVAYKRVMLKISGEALSGANGRRSWLSCWWRKHMER